MRYFIPIREILRFHLFSFIASYKVKNDLKNIGFLILRSEILFYDNCEEFIFSGFNKEGMVNFCENLEFWSITPKSKIYKIKYFDRLKSELIKIIKFNKDLEIKYLDKFVKENFFYRRFILG